MDKNAEYTSYLSNHLRGIKSGFNWIKENTPELFIHDGVDYSDIVLKNIINHDYSKVTNIEWIPYREYFYGDRTQEVKNNFNYAWLNHIHNNPHHWQYWILLEDEGNLITLEIPYEYIIEMFLDHWSFSWKIDNLSEIENWYTEHKDKIIMNAKSQDLYENILYSVMKIIHEKD